MYSIVGSHLLHQYIEKRGLETYLLTCLIFIIIYCSKLIPFDFICDSPIYTDFTSQEVARNTLKLPIVHPFLDSLY